MRTIKEVEVDMASFKGKKTTKGYRLLKEELKSLKSSPMGLGDVVESITKATGIKKVVEVVSEALDIDCGCEARKKEWNSITMESIKNIFKNKAKINRVSKEDYSILCTLFDKGMPSIVTVQQQRDAHKVYKNVFNINKQGTSCAPCLKGTLKELYDLYKLNSL